MLSCKETAELISQGLDRRLSWPKRVKLWMHLAMCGACSAYRRQVEALDRLIRRRFAHNPADADPPADEPCPPQTKQRITRALEQRLG